MKWKYLMALATLVVAGLFGSAHAALAAGSLHAFFPGGLPAHNARAAYSELMSRASVDTQMGNAIAQESGSASFSASAYVAVGYQSGAPGTGNSGVNDSGGLTPTADTAECNVHSLMFVIKDTRTGQIVVFCVSCGNIRLHVTQAPRYHRFTTGTVVRISKTFQRNFAFICQPSGQPVYAKVTTWVHGLIRAKTWVIAAGRIRAKTTVGWGVKINQTVKFRCGGVPMTTINLNKKWLDASGADITSSMSGEAVPVLVAVYDRGADGNWSQGNHPSYHITIHPGTPTTLAIASVHVGELIGACLDSTYEASKNAEPADPSGNYSSAWRCETSVIKNPAAPVNFAFTDRNIPPAPKPPSPPSPPSPPTPTPPAPKCTSCLPNPVTGGGPPPPQQPGEPAPQPGTPSNGQPPTGQSNDPPAPGGGELPDPG